MIDKEEKKQKGDHQDRIIRHGHHSDHCSRRKGLSVTPAFPLHGVYPTKYVPVTLVRTIILMFLMFKLKEAF
jgi:hypothetical protein